MSMKNFRAEDMPVKVAIAKDSQSKGSDKVQVSSGTRGGETPNVPSAPGAKERAASEPPDGTSKEVLDWVGDDKDRAQRALNKEQANEKPRVGLSEDLEKILADDDEDEAQDEDEK